MSKLINTTLVSRRRAFQLAMGGAAGVAVGGVGDPALVRADWIGGQSYDVKVTDLKKPPFNQFMADRQDAGTPPSGPIVSTEIPFQLVANVGYLIVAGNGLRKGMMLQNLDTTLTMYYAFGTEANIFSAQLAPGQILILDFVCPTNSVWAFSPVAMAGFYREFTPSSG